MVSDLLVANTGNLGIRIPDSPVVQQVIQAFGKPITATSLNVSGIPESGSLDETIMSLDWTNELLVYVVTDPDIVAFPSASTVITFATDPWQVLREGPITMEEIANAMTRPNYSDVQEWT
jgi:L-threonylcarbamoyladenylate synthase